MFQIIFNELSAAEMSALPKRMQLDLLEQKTTSEIAVAIFAFDENQRLRLVNRAGERLLAAPAERLLGQTAVELQMDVCLDGRENCAQGVHRRKRGPRVDRAARETARPGEARTPPETQGVKAMTAAELADYLGRHAAVLDALGSIVENRFQKAATMLTNGTDEFRSQLSKARGSIARARGSGRPTDDGDARGGELLRVVD